MNVILPRIHRYVDDSGEVREREPDPLTKEDLFHLCAMSVDWHIKDF